METPQSFVDFRNSNEREKEERRAKIIIDAVGYDCGATKEEIKQVLKVLGLVDDET